MSSTEVVRGDVTAWARLRRHIDPVKWGLRTTAILYLGLVVLLPAVVVILKGFGDGIALFQNAMSTPGAVEAVWLTLIMAFVTALINAVFGTLIAYVLVRFRFPGKGILATVVDLPFALPTLVTGLALVALYGPASPVGGWLEEHGIQVAFAPLGILLALLFVTLPLVIRTVQPVLDELDFAEEEAAVSLGAGQWTTFRRVVLPALRPAIVAGALLAFARAIGEFGSIIIVSGAIPGKTLTAPVFIFQLAGQFRAEEAAAVATLLFGISFVMVLITNKLLSGVRKDAE